MRCFLYYNTCTAQTVQQRNKVNTMQNTTQNTTQRAALQAKIDELVTLLEQCTCEDKRIDLTSEDDEVGLEMGGQVRTLRDLVDYYVD